MQRQFQHLDQVEVAGEDVGLLAEGPGLDAAAAAAGPGVLQRLALADLLLDHRVGVEDRGEAVAVADHPQGVLEQGVGRLAGELQVAAGLQQVHLVDDLQQQVRDLVGAVRAVGQQPAEVDVGEIGVGAALGRGHADLGRRRMVVELDEEGLQQFPGLLAASACRRPGPGGRTAAGAGRDGPGLNESQPFSSVITARWQNQ